MYADNESGDALILMLKLTDESMQIQLDARPTIRSPSTAALPMRNLFYWNGTNLGDAHWDTASEPQNTSR
jgi:hypothetical protein